MEKVKFELRNCYGISKLVMELPFNKVDSYGNLINAHIIYAPNGTMKTSLTDTIKDIQMKRQSMDFYYPERTTIRKVNEVLDDGTERELVEDDVLVIDSYDAQYKSEKMSTLLVNSVLKEKYERIYGGIISKYDQLINLLKKESGIKNEIESIITTDFNVPIKSIYDLFVEVAEKYTDFSESTLDTIKYSQVFNKDTLKVFDNPEFTKLIEEYIISYESLLVNNPVFKKSFNHTAAEVVVSSLSKNGFFKANHKVILDGTSDELDEKEFIKKVEEAKTLVLAQPEMTAKFNSLDALFSNAGGRDFRELLVRSKSLILELADLKELKRKLWISHIMKHQELFQELVLTYTNGKKELDSISKKALEEITIWEELPHYDTINNFLKELDNEQLEKIRKYMIKQMLEKRSFEHYRFMNKYWKIAIDATGMFSFKERHCEHCLRKVHKNKETGEVERIQYYHNVLEAKLVLGDMVFSIGTEFIENEKEDVEKQDCELKAFSRLADKIKKEYPRLPICILGDSLYACNRVFELCKNFKWKYILRFKEGSIPSIAEEFNILKSIESNEENGFNFVNDIDYNDKKINAAEYVEFVQGKKKKEIVERRFIFITNIEITRRNVADVIAAGRSRWKIENEGFNNQKNISYNLEHVCCENYNAMKNHYLLIQIADILKQLFEKGSEVFRLLKLSKKNISSKLKHSFSRENLNFKDILTSRIQIRDL